MHKKWSLNLGKVFGIRVFIHWTFLILISWIFIMHFRMGYGFSESLSGVIFISALFACIVLHEFGHSLIAKRFRVQTKDITIYPVGGVASLESMPAKPSHEIQAALAGPAVNIVIAIIIWASLKSKYQMLDFTAFQDGKFTALPFAVSLMYANIILAIFNLVPAFPMDGGRVLRSLFAMKMSRVRATSIAAKIGQFLAIVFVFFGFFYNFWLVFIGLFIFLGAGAESKIEEMKHALIGVKALNVMIAKFTVLHPDNTLQIAHRQLLHSNEKSFLIMENNQLAGILDYKSIVDGLREGKTNQKIEAFMQKDFYMLGDEDYLSDKFFLIQQENQSLFPVMKKEKLVGVISMENVYNWIHTNPYVFNH